MKFLILNALIVLMIACGSKEEIVRVNKKAKTNTTKAKKTPSFSSETSPEQITEEVESDMGIDCKENPEAEPCKIPQIGNVDNLFMTTPAQRAEMHKDCVAGTYDSNGNPATHAEIIELNTERIETNNNYACLIRTSLTPKVVKIKMRANMYEYKSFENKDEFIEFATDGKDFCGKDGDKEMRKAAAMIKAIGCQPVYKFVKDQNGNKKMVGLKARCVDHYSYNECNRFKKTIKMCKDQKNDDTLTLKFKNDLLEKDEFEVYRVYTRQGKKKGFLNPSRIFTKNDYKIDFNLKPISTVFPVKTKTEGRDTRVIKNIEDESAEN